MPPARRKQAFTRASGAFMKIKTAVKAGGVYPIPIPPKVVWDDGTL